MLAIKHIFDYLPITAMFAFIPRLKPWAFCSVRRNRGSGRGIKLGSAQRDIDFNKESGNLIFLSHETNYQSIRKLRVRNAMLKNGVRHCQVIWLRDPIDVTALDPHGFSYFDWEDLSKFENKNFDKTNNVGDKADVTYVWEFRSGDFHKTTHDPDELNEGYYVEIERGSSKYHSYQLREIRGEFGVKIWGIPKRFVKRVLENEDVSPLEDFLKEKYNEKNEYLITHMNDVAVHCVGDHNIHSTYSGINCAEISRKLPEDHSFKKWFDNSRSTLTGNAVAELKKTYDIRNVLANMLCLGEFKFTGDYEKVVEECLEKYPLLQIIANGMKNYTLSDKKAVKDINDTIVDYLLFAGKSQEESAETLEPF